MVGKAGLRPGAWSRHRPRLALAYARLAGVTAGVGERGVNAVRTSPGTTSAPAVNPAGIRPRARRPTPRRAAGCAGSSPRSEEHTSELQSLMRNSYAVFFLKKKKHR